MNGSANFENINFLRRFRIQSEILTDFQILVLQRIADSSIFWAWILDFVCFQLKYFCPDFQFRVKMEGQIWLINHNGSADLHTPFHPPLQVPRIDSQVSRIERLVKKFNVWFQQMSIPPPWKGFAKWLSLPSGFSKIGP